MSNFHEKNIRAYDKKAGHYNDTFDGKFTEKFKALLLANMDIKENDSVLDVGCGNGTLLSKLAEAKAISGFGIDISLQMIENAKLRYPEFQFAVSSCEKMPFPDNMMDTITVCAAFHHFPDVNAFASEAKRLIKQGGSLYIAEVCFPPLIRHIANVFLPLSKEGDVKFYSPKEIERIFSRVGFRLVNVIKQGHIQIMRLQIPFGGNP